MSERTKTRPNPKINAWLRSGDPAEQFVSVITLGEVRFGIDRLPPSANKTRLEEWYIDLTVFFAGRILPVTIETAELWGEILRRARRTLPVADSLLAATALQNALGVATRNVADFTDLGIHVVNPWA